MIYIFTALYCEAHSLIQHFHLKKVQDSRQFQQFASASAAIRLIVSGAGEIAAAAAVSSICTAYQPQPGDFLLNIGICAAAGGQEGIFLANKITEQASGRTFYPDLLYQHPFAEESLMTGMVPWMKKTGSDADAKSLSGPLCDMEAAAVYQAGAYFFGPHQMLFLKLVSDHGEVQAVSARRVEQLMEQHKDCLTGFIIQLSETSYSIRRHYDSRSIGQEGSLVRQLCADMHCSKAMEDSVRKRIHYLALTGADYQAMIRKLYEQKMLPCRDKRAGKKVFAEWNKWVF